MSLKERLKKSKLNQHTDIVEEKIPFAVQQEVQLNIDKNIKNKLLEDLSNKIYTTPDWNKYTEVEQKNLIVKFTEFQLNTKYKNDFSTSMQKQFFIRDIILAFSENNKLDFYLSEDEITSVFISGTKNFIVERRNKIENINNVFENITEIKIAVCKLLSTAKEIATKENLTKAWLQNGDLLFITDNGNDFTVKLEKCLTDTAVELLNNYNVLDSEQVKFIAGKLEHNKKVLVICDEGMTFQLLVKNVINMLDANDIMLSTGYFCPSEEKMNFHFSSFTMCPKSIPFDKIFINNIDNQDFLLILKNLLNSNAGAIVNLNGLSYKNILEEITLENYLQNIYIDKEFLKNTIENVFDYIVTLSANGIEGILSVTRTKEGNFIDEIYTKTNLIKPVKKAKVTKTKKK